MLIKVCWQKGWQSNTSGCAHFSTRQPRASKCKIPISFFLTGRQFGNGWTQILKYMCIYTIYYILHTVCLNIAWMTTFDQIRRAEDRLNCWLSEWSQSSGSSILRKASVFPFPMQPGKTREARSLTRFSISSTWYVHNSTYNKTSWLELFHRSLYDCCFFRFAPECEGQRPANQDCKEPQSLWEICPLRIWFYDSQNTFYLTVKGLKNAFFLHFHHCPPSIYSLFPIFLFQLACFSHIYLVKRKYAQIFV